MCGFDSCFEFCPFPLFHHHSLHSYAQVLRTAREIFLSLYLNASVNANGQAHGTVIYSDCWCSFKEYWTQRNAITNKYVLTIFLNVF
jgi:hypothetical protein